MGRRAEPFTPSKGGPLVGGRGGFRVEGFKGLEGGLTGLEGGLEGGLQGASRGA